MFDELKEAANATIQGVGGRIQLVKKENSDIHIPPSAVFASVSFCAKVVGETNIQHEQITSSLSRTEVKGLHNPQDGYLFHDGQTLTFKTFEQTLFSVPLNQLKVEQRGGVGLVLSLPDGRTYAIGNSIPLMDDKFAEPFKGVSMGEEGRWMTEFARLHVVDPVAYQQKVQSAKKTWVIWMAVFVAILILFAIIG